MATGETSWWSKDTVAVVTGANRGLGLEIVRQLAEHGLTVVLTSRDLAGGQAALDSLKAQGLKSVVFHTLDMCWPESATNLATWLKNEFGGIDILINNAAITSTTYSYENAESIMETNYRGLKYVTEALLPLLRASPAGARIICATSKAGLYDRLRSDSLKQKFRDEASYSEGMVDSLIAKYLEDVKAGRGDDEGWVENKIGRHPMYAESKMFLNVYTAVLAKSLSESQPEDHQIFVTSFDPGVALTGLYDNVVKGGFKLPEGIPLKTAAEGADTAVWLALLPKKELAGKVGKLFADRTEYPFGLKSARS